MLLSAPLVLPVPSGLAPQLAALTEPSPSEYTPSP